MTNQQLQDLFKDITLRHKNIFDVYLSLEQHTKEYKTTTFYSITKKSVHEAYDLYMRGIGFIDYIVALFKNADDNDMLDIYDRLSGILDIEQVMNQWSPENKELLNNLLPLIER